MTAPKDRPADFGDTGTTPAANSGSSGGPSLRLRPETRTSAKRTFFVMLAACGNREDHKERSGGRGFQWSTGLCQAPIMCMTWYAPYKLLRPDAGHMKAFLQLL